MPAGEEKATIRREIDAAWKKCVLFPDMLNNTF